MDPINAFYNKEVYPVLEGNLVNNTAKGAMILALITGTSLLAAHTHKKHKLLKNNKPAKIENSVINGYTVNQWHEMYKKFMAKYGNKLIKLTKETEANFEKEYLTMKKNNQYPYNLSQLFINDTNRIKYYFVFPKDHPESIPSMCSFLPIGSIITNENFKYLRVKLEELINNENLNKISTDPKSIEQIKNFSIENYGKCIEDTNKLYMKHINNFKRDAKAIGLPVKSIIEEPMTEAEDFCSMYAEFDFISIADLEGVRLEN